MRRAFLTTLLLLGFSTQAGAKPFECPRTGGGLVFGQERAVDTLDPVVMGAAGMGATRDILMNTHETLVTRDANNRPILDLAATVAESPDHLAYTFTLRRGVVFHDGQPLTATDVAASFARHARINGLPGIAGWETPDAETFVLRITEARPTVLETLSAFALPLFILPARQSASPPGQLILPIGTGPFRVTSFAPGGPITLARHEGYKPNPAFEDRDGFGGYKQACLDSVTFRFIPEPGARAAGLKGNTLHAVDDVPAKALPALSKDPGIAVLPLRHWWIQIAIPNVSAPPMDDLWFRRAVQAALDMDEIMEAASDGQYSLNVGFQYPTQPAHSDMGRETYNLKDPVLVRQLLVQAGYGGEPLILLTSKEPPALYNAALVTQQQLQAVGINAQMKVVDGRTSARMAEGFEGVWHLFFTRWGLQPALGPMATMNLLAGPNPVHRPLQPDDDLLAAWNDLRFAPLETSRVAAFARMQKRVLDQVYALPFGTLTKIQATRSNVRGFVPFYVPRLSNVWFTR